MNTTDRAIGHRKLMIAVWYEALRTYGSTSSQWEKMKVLNWIEKPNMVFELCASCMEMNPEMLRRRTLDKLRRLDDGELLKVRYARPA